MRHLDFREAVLVHNLVFFDHLAFPEKKRDDGVYLVGTQRTFLVERHASVDEIPQHRGIGRVNRHESWRLNSHLHARLKVRHRLRPLALIGRVPLGNDQRGSAPPISIGPMTCRTSLGDKELRTLRSGAVPRREFLASDGIDRDILGLYFFRSGGPADLIGSTLSPRGNSQDQYS